MIKTFNNDETLKIYLRQRSQRLPSDIQQVALRKLRMINNAVTINDLRVPVLATSLIRQYFGDIGQKFRLTIVLFPPSFARFILQYIRGGHLKDRRARTCAQNTR